MQSITATFQTITLITCGLVLLVGLAACRRWPDVRGLLVAPLLWALYGAVYYIFLLAGLFTPDALLLWGALHRLLAALMLLAGIGALWLIMKQPRPENDDECE